MILRAGGRDRQSFAFDTSVPIPRPGQWGSTLSHSGERVTLESASTLPAFLRGVRLICESAAGLPIKLYRGYDDKRQPKPNAPQLAILRRPNEDTTPFSTWQYVYASLLRGNAYIWKVKTKGELKALYPLNPACVTPKYEGDRPMFEVRDREGGVVREIVGRDRIIHIPGILLENPYVGVSIVEAARHGVGTELGRQRFEGRYIANDGKPAVILKHEGSPTPEQRAEMRAGYEARHMGPNNVGRVGMLWGGWDLQDGPVSLQDAQFIETKRYSVQDIGRMLGIPSGMLNDPDAPGGDSPEQENMRFLEHGLKPWMGRLEQGLSFDLDLFAEPDWDVEFDASGFTRADIKNRWDAYRLGRQGGWITANEIRTKEGLPSVEGGDEIQQTPVGGEANPDNTTKDGNDAADAA